jgi:predicted ATPase/DNA-binding SARP family transcriptional activator
VQGKEVASLSRAAQGLMALLALRRNVPLSRLRLAGLLWPDAAQARALFYLRRCLTELRSALGTERDRLITLPQGLLRLDIAGATCDLLAFDDLTLGSNGPDMEEIIALYRGELLEGYDAEWLLPEREVRAERYLAALEALAERQEQSGHLVEAARQLQRVVSADPLRESAHRRLMEVLGRMGDFTGVEKQYRELRRRLREELNMEPSGETLACYQRLLTQARTVAPLSAATPDSPVPTRRLPVPLTSLVGRTQERQEVRAALATACLVTLTGPGGVGKTRLALAVAEEVAEDYADGVWFADLAPVQDAQAVSQAVAAALGLRLEADTMPEEALRRHLGPKRLLLILDNAEHLLDACVHLTIPLLRACPALHILCTSRQPLSAPGEHIWPVAPLCVPPAPTEADPAVPLATSLIHYESVALLLDRVTAVVPSFQLTPRNAASIGQICRRLDGMPLALELVAARSRSLTVQEISTRLDDRFRLLVSGDPMLPRHKTLRAALDWSYHLLSEAEQSLLRHLTVFLGGWSLEAAEAICCDFRFLISDFGSQSASSPERSSVEDTAPIANPKSKIQNEEVLDLLTSLVDKSLVVHEEQEGQGRYRLLETTRAYAAELLSPPERQALQQRHADFFLQMAQSADTLGVEFQAEGWTERLWRERDNFRAAYAWWQEYEAERALWLEFFLYGTDTWPVLNARAWIQRLQQQTLPITSLSARMLYLVGSWALWLGDPASKPLLKRAVETATACGDARLKICALNMTMIWAEERGDLQQALADAEAALVCAQEIRDTFHAAGLNGKVAELLARQGAVAEAQRHLKVQLQEGRRSGDWCALYFALYFLGEVALEQGEHAEARAYTEECILLAQRYQPFALPNLWRRRGQAACAQQDYADAWHCYEQALLASRNYRSLDREGWTRWDMAEVAFRQGDAPQALEQLRQCLSLFEAADEPRSVTRCLRKFAKFYAAWGLPVRAVTLLGCVERAIQEQGFSLVPEEQDAANKLCAELRGVLDAAAWQAAWQHGARMTLAQALAYVASDP